MSSSTPPNLEKMSQACEHLPCIYVFPEEVPVLHELAKKLKKTLRLNLEDVVFDNLNKEILILRYSIEKNQQNLCPFYDEENKLCGIQKDQPLGCQSLPLTFESVEADSVSILVLGEAANSVNDGALDKMAQSFPTRFPNLKLYYTRYQQGLSFLSNLIEKKEISILQNQTTEEITKYLKEWKQIDVKPK
jgi:Fe-S-cluster containining protein